MNISDIENRLRQEKEALCDLLPPEFHKEFMSKAFIAGGCIYSLYNDIEPNDFDFFVTDQDFANRLFEFFGSYCTVYVKNMRQGSYKGVSILETKYAISIGRCQIITKYFGEPRDVVAEFDFKHNMYYFEDGHVKNGNDGDMWKDEVNYLDTNELFFNDGRVRDISGVIMRIPKFIKKGMKLPKREIAKMLNKLMKNGFDEREKEIIKDFMTY